jgi:hypothetical protein
MKIHPPTLGIAVAALLWGAPLYGEELLPPDRPIEQVVDHYLDEGLKQAGVKAAPQADDATVLRRLTLDLNGRIPTPAELHAWLTDTAADRRVKLVERLLASPAYARYQAVEFEGMLAYAGGGKKGRGPSGALRSYLQTAFAENRGWDQIFRELILADETDARRKGSAEFLRARVKELDRLTTDVSVLFFGVNISCAQCHDHPLVEDWKQDHYYGMKSFFARLSEKGTSLAEKPNGVVKYTPHKGAEKTAPIMFLSGKVVDPAVKALRPKLVEIALEQRDYFARAIVNRVWHRLFGQGLVTPLDQMHSENPPSHPELLAWLARDLAEHGYDLRRLTRGLVLSQAYSRSSRWDGERVPPAKLFAFAPLRPLTPTQLATSLRLATLDPDSLPAGGDTLEKRIEEIEKGAAPLARYFAQPGDGFQVGVGEALLFSNSEALAKECLEDAKGRLVARLKDVKEPEKRAELAVRSVLARAARTEEVAAMAAYLRKRADRPAAATRQVVWALLAGAEFRFNH